MSDEKITVNPYQGVVYPKDVTMVLAPSFKVFRFFASERKTDSTIYVYAMSRYQLDCMHPECKVIGLPGWENVLVNHFFESLIRS